MAFSLQDCQNASSCLGSRIPLVTSQIGTLGKYLRVMANKSLQFGFSSGSPPISCILPINPCVTSLKAFISFS